MFTPLLIAPFWRLEDYKGNEYRRTNSRALLGRTTSRRSDHRPEWRAATSASDISFRSSYISKKYRHKVESLRIWKKKYRW